MRLKAYTTSKAGTSMMRTNIRRVAACIALCACLFPASAAESMTLTIEMYFADLKADVADAAHRATVAAGRQSRDINAGFKQLVKQHQPLTALLKTNSSGIVVNRYVRNTKTTKKIVFGIFMIPLAI